MSLTKEQADTIQEILGGIVVQDGDDFGVLLDFDGAVGSMIDVADVGMVILGASGKVIPESIKYMEQEYGIKVVE
jgi:hypothetical protein